MKAMEFRILLEKLILKDWDRWEKKDRKYIRTVAEKNHIKVVEVPDEGAALFYGKPDHLYFFLYDVAYRYDVELV